MEIIPSISFKNEEPVIVKDGNYDYYSEDGQVLNLDEILTKLRDYDKIYYLDIDGINKNKPQIDVIRELSLRKELWGDTGARDENGITDAFVAGIHRAVLSTKTAYKWDVFEKSARMSDKLIMGIDIDESVVSPSEKIRKMSVREIVRDALDIGIDTFVIADLSESEFDRKTLDMLPEGDYQVYIGGISKERIVDMHHPNLSGFILGLKEAIQYKRN
ncbi:MAG: HisA/HisF-related TIM barrel protein [Thermoplasmata archaeon]